MDPLNFRVYADGMIKYWYVKMRIMLTEPSYHYIQTQLEVWNELGEPGSLYLPCPPFLDIF